MGEAAQFLAKEETVRLVLDILNSIKADSDPSRHIQQVGSAISQIGGVLEGHSVIECRRVLQAVAAFHGFAR